MKIENTYFLRIRSFIGEKPHIFYSVLAVLAFFLLSIIFFYTASREVPQVKKTVQFFPYPIVWVDGHVITEAALAKNMDSVKRFYVNQDFSSLGLRVDFSTEDGQKRLQVREREVLNKMVEDRAFKAIAKGKNIEISDEEVKEDIKSRIEAYGTGSEVEENLQKLYGWNVKDFAQKVVTPALYQTRLEEIFQKEVNQDGARKKIEEAEKELVGGKNFAEVAKTYSEGSTGENGGTLGWFQLADLAPELQSTVQNLPVGQVSAIVESSLGFHIVLVEETKTDSDATLYRLSQIFVKKIAFSTWLTEEMQKLNIHVWSPLYVWNQERAQVDFQDESWQQFEQSVYENSTQDALFVN